MRICVFEGQMNDCFFKSSLPLVAEMSNAKAQIQETEKIKKETNF